MHTDGPGRARPFLRQRSEEGFGLVEALVGMVILMVVLISLTNLLIDSLSTALANKQREAAASLASDVIENGKALGETCLLGGSCPTFTQSSFTLVKGTLASYRTQATPYSVDGTAYTVTPSITCGGATCPASGYTGAVSIAVTVTWPEAGHTFAYVTSTQVTGN